jgi:hypothetical protein
MREEKYGYVHIVENHILERHVVEGEGQMGRGESLPWSNL